jgi:hypothetical protein
MKPGARGQGSDGAGCRFKNSPGSIFLLFLLAGLAHGAIFPDQIGDFRKSPPKTVSAPDRALYNEYGFLAMEQAQYSSGDKHFLATAWRMHDSTGAMALF